jgi:predicted nucleotidyltransferase
MTLIEQIKTYIETRDEIAFAFLFGSQANGLATGLSDVDIAVYFYPNNRRPIEFEEPVYFEEESELWRDLERLLKKEVELLVLNRVPATIAASAIRGIPITIRDWGIYLDFIEVVTTEAIDFRYLLISDFKERYGRRN